MTFWVETDIEIKRILLLKSSQTLALCTFNYSLRMQDRHLVVSHHINSKISPEENTVSSKSGVGKARQLHVKQQNLNIPSNHIQKQTPNGLKT